MYQALTQDEWEWEGCKNEHSFFMESLHQALGPHARLSDLVNLGVEETPQDDPYEDGLQNAETFPMLDEEPEVTPEGGLICECRNTAPKRGQDGKKPCDTPEA